MRLVLLCLPFAAFLPFLLSASADERAETATIVHSGSSNTPGARIVVKRSGLGEYTALSRRFSPNPETPSPQHRHIPEPLLRRLFADLDAASPLTSLPRQHCMKSASFGTTLIIERGDQRTPDLNCGDGGDPRLRALIQDARDIQALFR